jgi:hypothetical protein
MKTTLFILGLLVCSTLGFSQQEEKGTYFKYYQMNFDKTDKLDETIDASAMKDGEYYFMVKAKDNRTTSLGYYDNKGNIKSFLLDRYYNLYFNYITYDYKNDLMAVKNFKDVQDFTLAKIEFEYNDAKKISKTVVWSYSLPKRRLEKLEETLYRYTGDTYDVVERFNNRDQTYEKMVYKGNKDMQEYERYDIDGKTLQYLVKFYYEADKIAKKEFYSKTNVLIKTIAVKP